MREGELDAQSEVGLSVDVRSKCSFLPSAASKQHWIQQLIFTQ